MQSGARRAGRNNPPAIAAASGTERAGEARASAASLSEGPEGTGAQRQPERQERERNGASRRSASECSELERGAGGNRRGAPRAPKSASGTERAGEARASAASLSEGPEGTGAERRPRAPKMERYRSGRNGGASKASCRVTGTGVRIPPSPPDFARPTGELRLGRAFGPAVFYANDSPGEVCLAVARETGGGGLARTHTPAPVCS